VQFIFAGTSTSRRCRISLFSSSLSAVLATILPPLLALRRKLHHHHLRQSTYCAACAVTVVRAQAVTAAVFGW